MRAALSASGRQDVPTQEEQALYLNLCILGIVSSGLKQEGIELGRTTFRRSNNKALEYVLYRLYSIIEGKSRAQKDFKGMLPVLDKVQQAPFYQRIGDWMMELKKSSRIDPSVILPVSALKTNTSNRLVLLLLELSSVALQQDLETTGLGALQTGFLSTGSFAAGSMGGALDDTIIPAEARLTGSVVRAKKTCGAFLGSAATSSNTCEAMEQHFLEYKKKYYELQAAIRQQVASLAGLPDGFTPAAAGSSPRSTTLGSPTASSAVTRTGSGVLVGPAAAAAGGGWEPSDPAVPGGAPDALRPTRPDPESLAALSSLLAGLDEHLRVHMELEKALVTDSSGAADGSDAAAGGSGGASAAGGFADPALRFGQAPQRQVLHPYQIDGQALAAEMQAAAAAARGGGHNGSDAQRRFGPPSCGPQDILGAFSHFNSTLQAALPRLNQLAMSGENAGPPPLLQLPSQPSSHAAHVAHQLQVHAIANRQITALNRKVQENITAMGPVLRNLRLESSRATSGHDPSGHPDLFHDFLDEDLMDVAPHLALPPALAQPVRQISNPPLASPKPAGLGAAALAAASSGAPSAVAMGSPCPSSAGAYMAVNGAALASGASACASASASVGVMAGPSAGVVATSTIAAPTELGTRAAFGDDEYARLQARLKNLKLPGQPAHGHAAVAGLGAAAAPGSARARDAGTGTAAPTASGMLSPSATLNGIGFSPMAMSGPGATARQQPLSATVQPVPFEYLSAASQPAAGDSYLSPLRMAPSLQAGRLGFEAVPFERAKAPEQSKNPLGAAEARSSDPWVPTASLFGDARPDVAAAPVMAGPAAPQAWASVPGRQLNDSSVAPAWMPAPHNAANPTSRRALDPQFRQQQQPQQQYVQGGTAASAGGAISQFGGPFQDAPADWRGLSGRDGAALAATSTTSAAAVQPAPPQWPEVDGLRPVASCTGLDGARVTGPISGGGFAPQNSWDEFHGAAASASLGGAAARHTLATQVQARPAPEACSSGRVNGGEDRRVDLRGLLDDDDEMDCVGGRFPMPGPSFGNGDAQPNSGAAGFGFSGPMGSFGVDTEHDGGSAFTAAGGGSLHADFDADADDFSLLAAEGELVGQALMSGGLATAGAAAPAAATTAGLFGSSSGGGWASYSGGGAGKCSSEMDAAPTGAAPRSAQRSSFGNVADADNGDDVVVTDNDKEASPGFSGAKGRRASWLGAAPAAGAGPGVAGLGQGQAKAPLFDAFGALMSPQQQQQQGHGAGRVQHAAAPATAMPPPPAGHLGADVLALKERMRAISMQQ